MGAGASGALTVRSPPPPESLLTMTTGQEKQEFQTELSVRIIFQKASSTKTQANFYHAPPPTFQHQTLSYVQRGAARRSSCG